MDREIFLERNPEMNPETGLELYPEINQETDSEMDGPVSFVFSPLDCSKSMILRI
jgi:hypothetical protein